MGKVPNKNGTHHLGFFHMKKKYVKNTEKEI